MEYSKAAREVIETFRSVRESDESIWFDRALIAVADLYPTSALAFALHQPDVWPRDRRRRLRAETNPPVRNGFSLEDLVGNAEAAAASDGGRIVFEVHLAKAFADFAQILLGLGIAADALVARTQERESLPPAIPAPKRPRVVGAARVQLLDEAIANQDLLHLLAQDERTGTVERKRSILNSQARAPGVLMDQELATVALVNGSPETAVYLLFGQEDDFSVVGQIDQSGKPLDESTVRACQRRFDERLQACHPPIPVKWREVTSENRRVWIACMFGRARGTAVRTTLGAYPYRSGEDTHYATPEQITAWLREPTDVDPARAAVREDQQARAETLAGPEEGRAQRLALSELDRALDTFFQTPPTIPNAIRGHKLTDWEPVFGPILGHFRPAMDAVVQAGLQSSDSALSRLARGLRTVFRVDQPRGGLSWISEAPRLVTRLVTDRLLLEAYGTERWSRLVQIGEPLFESYNGRVPWVLSPEYRHPETLGRDANVANELALQEILRDTPALRRVGLTESRISPVYAAMTVGLALASMARDEASSSAGRFAAWAMLQGVWAELGTWEEEPELVGAFAALAGESDVNFRKSLPDRLSRIVAAFRSAGYWPNVPDAVWASVKRMAEDAG